MNGYKGVPLQNLWPLLRGYYCKVIKNLDCRVEDGEDLLKSSPVMHEAAFADTHPSWVAETGGSAVQGSSLVTL